MTSLVRRALLAAAVLVAVSYASFVFFQTKFGVGATAYANGVGQASRFWWHWVGQLVHGDFTSVGGRRSDLWVAFGHTGALLALTGVLVLVFSVALGALTATHAGTPLDLVLRLLSYVAWGIPAFVLALVLWSTTRVQGWPGRCAPFGGYCQPGQAPTSAGLAAILGHLALPAAALSVSFIGLHARYLRSSLLVALHAPYSTTARAKGLSERRVVFGHALRNSLATFVSSLLLDFGAIFGAALAVDYVFRLDGVGSLFLVDISAFTERGGINIDSVSLLLTICAGLVLLASFAAEAAVLWLDPRARQR